MTGDPERLVGCGKSEREAGAVRRLGLVVVVLAALVACTPPPERVPGDPAPVTVGPSGGTASAVGPTRPPGSATPAGVAQFPTGYEVFEVTGHGVTARLTVPSVWSRTPITHDGAVGTQFVDPSGAQKFRVEILARADGRTARQGFEAYEPTVGLREYRRLDLVDVPGVGESAVDWSFSFTDDHEPRQVVDRMLVQGSAAVAVYYSTTQADFERLMPIWQQAVERLVIASG
jgi:hypothetical protein